MPDIGDVSPARRSNRLGLGTMRNDLTRILPRAQVDKVVNRMSRLTRDATSSGSCLPIFQTGARAILGANKPRMLLATVLYLYNGRMIATCRTWRCGSAGALALAPVYPCQLKNQLKRFTKECNHCCQILRQAKEVFFLRTGLTESRIPAA